MATMNRAPEVVEGHSLVAGVPRLPPGTFAIPTADGAPLFFPDESSHPNILIIGGIGQGKTNAICHLLRSAVIAMGPDDVAVVFDTKGDYSARFRRPGDIVINDLSLPQDQNPWNLLEELRVAHADIREEVLSEIGHTLFGEAIERTQQVFFPMAAKDLFCGVLTDIAALGGSTNQSVREFWDRTSTADLRKWLAGPGKPRWLLSYISDPGPQTQGVISTVLQVIHDVFLGHFAQVGTLSIQQLLRNKGGKCIFIEYDIAVGAAQAAMQRLLIDLAIKEALSRKRVSGRVFFFIDEFRLLPHLMHLDHGLNFGRECGLRFIVGMQNNGQVMTSYQKEAQSILSAFNTVLAFRVTDPETREFIKGLAGRNRKRVAVPSLVPGRPIEQIVEGHVIEDYQIWDLTQGEAIAMLPNTEGPTKVRTTLFGRHLLG